MSAGSWPQDPQEDSAERIGADLRGRRAAAGLSVRAVADAAHYSHTTINDAELGKSIPTADVVSGYVRATEGSHDDVRQWVERVTRFRDHVKTGDASQPDEPPAADAGDAQKTQPPAELSGPASPQITGAPDTGDGREPGWQRPARSGWRSWLTPLLVLATVALVGMGGARLLENRRLAQNSIDIGYPAPASVVDSPVKARGSVRLSRGRSLWILIQPAGNDTMYSTTDAEVAVTSEGTFSTNIDAGRGPCDEGRTFTIVSLSMPRGGSLDRAIEARKPGQYSARLTDIPQDAIELDRRRFTVGTYRGKHDKC